MENFFTVGQQVLILFLLIFVGFLLGKRQILGDAGAAACSNIALYLAMPSVIIRAFQQPYSHELMLQLLAALSVSALIHGVAMVLGWMFYRGGAPRNRVMRLSVVMSNAGFMALPLQEALLGETGVFYGTAYVAVFNLILWSYGVLVMDPSCKKLSLKKVLLTPGTIGVGIALVLFVLSIELPEVLRAPINHFANLNTPLPMLFVGYSLSKIDFRRTFIQWEVYGAALLRLVVVPAISVVLLFLIGVRGTLLVSMAIAVSAPTAASAPMFATKFGGDTEAAVNVVAITTILSLLTMPMLVAGTQMFPG